MSLKLVAIMMLACGQFALAEPIPGDIDCQKKPEKCSSLASKSLTTPLASSAVPATSTPLVSSALLVTSTPKASSTLPLMSTTTYTTSYCSVTSAVPFTTRPQTWYEQSCTPITRTTTTTDYSLQWECSTSTVTASYTMDNKFVGGS
jgi:hypothetical protein